MTEHDEHETVRQMSLGMDLILPLSAASYAAYYVYTIAHLPREAQIIGVFIASAIWLLTGSFIVRALVRLRSGEIGLRPEILTMPVAKLFQRSAFVLLTGANIFLMPYLGFCLTTMLFLAAAMFLLGVRDLRSLVSIPLAAGALGYLFFIVALDTRLPQGPVEQLLQWSFQAGL